MINIISEIGLLLGIIITVIGARKHNKQFKYIGVALIALCLIGMAPSLIGSFTQGFRDGMSAH